MHKLLILLLAMLLSAVYGGSAAMPEVRQGEATAEATAETTLAPTPAERTREVLEAYLGWMCPEEVRGGTLNIYNWALYIGLTTVSDFEVLCDVSVIYDTYASNEDMLARLRQGNPGYDIVVPSHFVVGTMIDEELLTPINLENIPNFANVSEALQNPDYDLGNQYTIPYQWGTVGIAYNATVITEPFSSWQEFFEYDGRVAWIEDPRALFSIALVMLGYDPNTTNAAEIEAARDFLIANGENVVTIATGNTQQLLSSGEIDATVDYNGNSFQLQAACECLDYQYVIPEEGANIWIDNVAIPADAPHVRTAEAFMDYLLLPQVSADISNYTAYATPNQVALDLALIDPLMLDNPVIYPDAETLERLFFTQSNPETDQLYLDAWDAVKVALSL